MNPDTTVTTNIDKEQDWINYPLGDDVLEGNPNCKMKIMRTVGVVTAYKAVAFFTAEPSKFRWKFDNDEAFVLLEGRIAITLETGERVELGPGDAVSFPGGHTGVCEVYEYSRKFTVVTNGTSIPK